jgi:hypothetical protein
MFAVKGIYDGVSAKPKEKVPFDENYEVIITFIKPRTKKHSAIKKRNELLDVADFIDSISSDNPPANLPSMKEIVAECKESRKKIYNKEHKNAQ